MPKIQRVKVLLWGLKYPSHDMRIIQRESGASYPYRGGLVELVVLGNVGQGDDVDAFVTQLFKLFGACLTTDCT